MAFRAPMPVLRGTGTENKPASNRRKRWSSAMSNIRLQEMIETKKKKKIPSLSPPNKQRPQLWKAVTHSQSGRRKDSLKTVGRIPFSSSPFLSSQDSFLLQLGHKRWPWLRAKGEGRQSGCPLLAKICLCPSAVVGLARLDLSRPRCTCEHIHQEFKHKSWKPFFFLYNLKPRGSHKQRINTRANKAEYQKNPTIKHLSLRHSLSFSFKTIFQTYSPPPVHPCSLREPVERGHCSNCTRCMCRGKGAGTHPFI